MKKRYAALAIALASLLAFVVLAASHNDSTREVGQSHVVRAPVAVHPQAAPAAPADPTTIEQEPAALPVSDWREVERPPAADADQASVTTGCGKAVPCPNRDCKDCPYNIHLR